MEGCSRILQLKTPRSWVLWVYPLKELFGAPDDPSIFLEFCQNCVPMSGSSGFAESPNTFIVKEAVLFV